MSIDKRRDRKDYVLDFKGTRADFEALADVLEKAEKRVNVDLYPDKRDIPGRIVLKEGTPFQYSRVKRALKEMAAGLRSEDRGVSINLGDIDIKERKSHEKEEWLSIMDAVTKGDDTRLVKAVGIPIVNAMEDTNLFTVREYAEVGEGRSEILSKMNIQWMYAESLIGPERTSDEVMVRRVIDVEGLDEYPPKLNMRQKKRLGRWAEKEGFDRAYIVMMETDRVFPMTEAIHTRPGRWNKLIRELAAGSAILNKYENHPPRNMGDLMIRIAAYATGRAFDMKNAVVMPFDLSKMGTMPLVGEDDYEKILKRENILVTRRIEGEKYPQYRHFFAFLVVGKGPYKPLGLTRVVEEDPSDITLPEL